MIDKVLEGKKAEQLLNDPIFKKVVSTLRDKYHSRIERSRAEDADLREDCYHLLRALKNLVAEIEDVVASGMVEESTRANIAAIDRHNQLKR